MSLIVQSPTRLVVMSVQELITKVVESYDLREFIGECEENFTVDDLRLLLKKINDLGPSQHLDFQVAEFLCSICWTPMDIIAEFRREISMCTYFVLCANSDFSLEEIQKAVLKWDWGTIKYRSEVPYLANRRINSEQFDRIVRTYMNDFDSFNEFEKRPLWELISKNVALSETQIGIVKALLRRE